MDQQTEQKATERGTTGKVEKRTGGTFGYKLTIAILMVICGVLLWMVMNQKTKIETIIVEKENVGAERDQLKGELNDMLVQYDDLKTNNSEMNTKIEQQQAQIQEMMKQIEKHKDDAFIIRKLKKETETLREIMKGFVHTIDSLNTLNINLREEKKVVEQHLDKEKEKYSQLDKVRENLEDKVKVGSRLQSYNIVTAGLIKRNNGMHRETNRAKKTDVLKCCLMLRENKISKPGTKDIYARIIAPNAQVLPAEGEEAIATFMFNGMKGTYSIKKQIEYQNVEIEVCMYYNVQQELPPGDYIVEVYSDEADIGRVTLKLK